MFNLFTAAALIVVATSEDTVTKETEAKEKKPLETCETCHEPPARHRLMNMFDRFLSTPGWWHPTPKKKPTSPRVGEGKGVASVAWPQWPSLWEGARWGSSDLSLATDIAEDKNQYSLIVDLPGFNMKQINVTVDNGVLMIKAEKDETVEEKDKSWHRRERRVGSFSRSFTIPVTVDEDKITSEFERGCLTVTLPKKEEAKLPPKEPKQIEVVIKETAS